jgi:beta-lactamase class A
MIRSLRKWFIILLILVLGGFLLVRAFQYRLSRDNFPEGTTIAGLDVSGMVEDEAKQLLAESYGSSIYVYHKVEHVELDPGEIGFVLNVESMIAEVKEQINDRSEWIRFASFLLKRSLEPIDVTLQASHDDEAVEALLLSMSELLDEPATAAQVLIAGGAVREGEAGYVTDVEASVPIVEDALYRHENRVAKLAILSQESPEITLDLLKETIEAELQGFNGLGSVFIIDLQTGEEIGINADVAMSGLSILKIAIFVEAFRAIDGEPDAEQQELFLDTATRSSNYGANLLLHVVAGEDNTYAGADVVTESMRRLGLENTFIAVPYDATPPGYRQTTYVTPANSRNNSEVELDETMQSTAEEIGTLLSMIYHCSKGGGALLALYPGEITPSECQSIIDLMVLNEEGNLIRFGVPDGVPVSHKHGWAQGTHADAGIVLSPGGDFVIVEYLHQPGGWLVADYSFPILREIARASYNYFNMDDPYLPSDINGQGEIDASDPFSEQHGEDATPPTPDAESGEPSDSAPGDGSSGSDSQSQDGSSG